MYFCSGVCAILIFNLHFSFQLSFVHVYLFVGTRFIRCFAGWSVDCLVSQLCCYFFFCVQMNWAVRKMARLIPLQSANCVRPFHRNESIELCIFSRLFSEITLYVNIFLAISVTHARTQTEWKTPTFRTWCFNFLDSFN